MGVSWTGGPQIAGWFIRENLNLKWMMTRCYPWFRKPPKNPLKKPTICPAAPSELPHWISCTSQSCSWTVPCCFSMLASVYIDDHSELGWFKDRKKYKCKHASNHLIFSSSLDSANATIGIPIAGDQNMVPFSKLNKLPFVLDDKLYESWKWKSRPQTVEIATNGNWSQLSPLVISYLPEN